ncbi:MAG: hypothetical protein AAAB19_15745, partial [Rhizobium sp.]
TGLERRKCGIIGAVADCAFTSLHSLIPSRAWLRLGLATGSGLDAPDIRKDSICPASEGYEAFKRQSLLILREQRRRSLCAHTYVAALIKLSGRNM